MLFLCDIF